MSCRIVETQRVSTAVVRVDAPMNKLPETQRAARGKLAAVVPGLDASSVGLTCTRWQPPSNGAMKMEPGMIVERSFAAAGDVVPSELPAGRAAHLVLTGSFEKIPDGWKTLFDWCTAQKLILAGVNWEVYGATPADPGQQETFLYALIAA